jgi:hypothetical protein
MKGSKRKKIPSAVIDGLAKDLGKSLRTCRDYIRCGLPVSAKGYDLGKVQAWLNERWLDRRRGMTQDAPEDERKWIAQYRRYKAQRQKLEYQKEMGRLIELETAKSWLVELLTICRQALVALPDHLAGEVYRSCGNRMTSVQVSESSKMIVRQVLVEIRQGIAKAGEFDLPNDEELAQNGPDAKALESLKSGSECKTAPDPAGTDRPLVKSPSGKGP